MAPNRKATKEGTNECGTSTRTNDYSDIYIDIYITIYQASPLLQLSTSLGRERLGESAVGATKGGTRSAYTMGPWGLWTLAAEPAKDTYVSQASITAVMEESRRTHLDMDLRQRDHTDFIWKEGVDTVR